MKSTPIARKCFPFQTGDLVTVTPASASFQLVPYKKIKYMKSTPIARKCFPFQTGDLVPVATRRKEYIETHRTSNPAGRVDGQTKEEIELGQAFDAMEAKRIPRAFPSSDEVYHFHPIAFVEQMKLIVGNTKLNEVLEEMKLLVDKHIPYSQQGERSSLSEEGLKELDCSETVGIYLHKLGCMPKYKAIHTGLMTTEEKFRKAIGSNKIKFVEGSKEADFVPEPGDIFVWRRKRIKKGKNGKDIIKYDGHTGIVYKYEAAKNVVWILEAIGSGGASGESQQVKNGGHSGVDCTRTAIYNVNSKALNMHDGWVGYYRPN